MYWKLDSKYTLLVFSSWICSLQRFGEVTFGSLVPPEANRTTAAHTLYKLLGEEIKRHFFLKNEHIMFCLLRMHFNAISIQ